MFRYYFIFRFFGITLTLIQDAVHLILGFRKNQDLGTFKFQSLVFIGYNFLFLILTSQICATISTSLQEEETFWVTHKPIIEKILQDYKELQKISTKIDVLLKFQGSELLHTFPLSNPAIKYLERPTPFSKPILILTRVKNAKIFHTHDKIICESFFNQIKSNKSHILNNFTFFPLLSDLEFLMKKHSFYFDELSSFPKQPEFPDILKKAYIEYYFQSALVQSQILSYFHIKQNGINSYDNFNSKFLNSKFPLSLVLKTEKRH